MIVYHGAHIENFKPNQIIKSRYGIPVLFFTTNHILAKMYKGKNGKLFQAEIHPDKLINFNGEVSHSRKFRNLIYKLYKQNYGSILITNIYDRPNSDFSFEKSDIMIVFDFGKIKNLHHAFN
jgi:hypothetical protein